MSWCHSSSLAAHPGIAKTVQLYQRKFWWEGLSADVLKFVQTCAVCSQNKDSHSKPAGLLQIMPIPPLPWHTISLDFITDMPNSGGLDTILVVIDSFSKMGHFIPLKGVPTARSESVV